MKVNILGIWLESLTVTQAVARVAEFVAGAVPRRIVTANPEIIYRARADEGLQQLINSADLITADGEGVIWAARFLGTPLPERVTGIDLLLALFPLAGSHHWRVFLLGAAPGVAAEAARNIKADYPGIELASSYGYFRSGQEERNVLDQIRDFRPHILLVGMGAPRQEEWIRTHYQQLGVPVSIGVGGSFDVLSGRVKRAPRWARRLKLEWLARLVREPSRFKRQTALPKFAWSIIKYKFFPNPQKN